MAEKIYRTRNYVSILYPESAPDNWRELLQEQFVPAFVSPLHCQDLNPDGEIKKPHYHIMIMFDSVKTIEQAQEVFTSIGAIHCQAVKSLRGQARYFCHLDNPEKAQYSIEDVTCFCGADYRNVIELQSDARATLKEIQYFIMSNNITSFGSLADYALENREDWFIVISEKYSYYLDKYIKSKSWTNKNDIVKG